MLKILTGLQGQKLKWTGFDPDTEQFLLLFEGGTTISVDSEGITNPSDGKDVLTSLVETFGEFSKQVVSLGNVLNPLPIPEEVDPQAIVFLNGQEFTVVEIYKKLPKSFTEPILPLVAIGVSPEDLEGPSASGIEVCMAAIQEAADNAVAAGFIDQKTEQEQE